MFTPDAPHDYWASFILALYSPHLAYGAIGSAIFENCMSEQQVTEQSLRVFRTLGEFLVSGNASGIITDLGGFYQATSTSPGTSGSMFRLKSTHFVARCPDCEQQCVFQPLGFPSIHSEHACAVLHFRCRNCSTGLRRYFIAFDRPREEDERIRVALNWAFPSALDDEQDRTQNHLTGNLLQYYRAGREAEAARLGLGAFTYYRRVVEGLKDEIFDKIIQVAEQEATHAELIEQLKRAKEHRQFETSFKEIKGVLPRRLLISDMSPISLLNTSLSNGIHAHSDSDCLEIAQDVRMVLGHLLKRLEELLREDDVHLRAAVQRLHARNQDSKKRPVGAVE